MFAGKLDSFILARNSTFTCLTTGDLARSALTCEIFSITLTNLLSSVLFVHSYVIFFIKGFMTNENTQSVLIRQEITRFESVHPSIYAIHELLDQLTDENFNEIQDEIREHVTNIEGKYPFPCLSLSYFCITLHGLFILFIFIHVVMHHCMSCCHVIIVIVTLSAYVPFWNP